MADYLRGNSGQKRKTMAYLLRRGYPSSIVHQAVNRVMEEIQSETGE
ncbi:hypothetical protein [Paenibacillus larvae]